MTLYKVGNNSPSEEIYLDSKINNYGDNFSDKYDHLLESYFNVALKINLPVDFLIFINNGIAMFGQNFIDETIKPAISKEGYVNLHKISSKPEYKGFGIPVALLNEFLQSFDDVNPFIVFNEGNYLWERYFEIVRMKIFPTLPNRKECLFFFDNIEDCNYYINKHRAGYGTIYQVEILEAETLIKRDMKIIDDISLSVSYNNLIKTIYNYWDEDYSDSPIIEYLFKGKCKLKPLY